LTAIIFRFLASFMIAQSMHAAQIVRRGRCCRLFIEADAAPLKTVMAGLAGLVESLLAAGARLLEGLGGAGIKRAVIAPQLERVMPACGQDRLSQFRMTMQRIRGHGVALQIQAFQSLDGCLGLVAMTTGPPAAGASGALVRLAEKYRVALRQSYARVGKLALIKQQRYAHAKQFKRAGKSLRKLETYLRRAIRDIARKIAGNKLLKPVFATPLPLSYRVLTQKKRQKAPKVYSLHAPEVECIGKGKAHKPYEFGVKVSLATTIAPAKGGQFILHARALPGAPYDGHTLESVIQEIEATTGATLSRILADAGYKGHKTPPGYTFKVYTQG
jgi:hypothetical protein